MERKIWKRICLGMTVIAMLVSMISGVDFTGRTLQTDAAGVTLSNPTKDANGVVTWDCVYFGNYYQSDTTGTTKEPIKWRVLSVNGNDAFLLADKNLDCKRFNEKWAGVTWETCTLRSWLNGYDSTNNSAGKDYTNDNFLDTAFTASEQAVIKNTTVIAEDNPYSGVDGGNDTQDKIYLLSISEASNSAYGFGTTFTIADKGREVRNTTYTREKGARTESKDGYEENGDWWLRTADKEAYRTAGVNHDGCGYNLYGDFVDDSSVRFKDGYPCGIFCGSDFCRNCH